MFLKPIRDLTLAAFLAFTQAAQAQEWDKPASEAIPTIDSLSSCSDNILFDGNNGSPTPNHPISDAALKLGCLVQKKVIAQDLGYDISQEEIEGALHDQIKFIQTLLNDYKNSNEFLSILPDLKVDGILGRRTAEILFGLARDFELYDIFFDTYRPHIDTNQSIYMRHFRNYLTDTNSAVYLEELRLWLQDYAQKNAPSIEPLTPNPQEQPADCPTSFLNRRGACPEV